MQQNWYNTENPIPFRPLSPKRVYYTRCNRNYSRRDLGTIAFGICLVALSVVGVAAVEWRQLDRHVLRILHVDRKFVALQIALGLRSHPLNSSGRGIWKVITPSSSASAYRPSSALKPLTWQIQSISASEIDSPVSASRTVTDTSSPSYPPSKQFSSGCK
ncbi:hypothetical protein [Halalkalicoccus salilacus]|uniref:hypothetical protein n=1 Tax=Halalkalicoccus salilacus TaxID=3117459 RepID=UPI00300F1CDD